LIANLTSPDACSKFPFIVFTVDTTRYLVHYLVMIKVNMHDAKTHLSEYLTRLKGDERIILCKRNAPIAEIRLLPRHNANRRPIGLAAGTFSVPESFFEPLPEETLAGFRGEHG